MTETNPNIYLLILTALGWAISLYFGFFRYRQYIWSRNKVRYDLLHKMDQRRSNIATKLLMFQEISTAAKPRKARLRLLFGRYLSLLEQINFYESEGVFDSTIIKHLQAAIHKDMGLIVAPDNDLKAIINAWLQREAKPGNFISTLQLEQFLQ